MYYLNYLDGTIRFESYNYIYDVMLPEWKLYHGEFTGLLGRNE